MSRPQERCDFSAPIQNMMSGDGMQPQRSATPKGPHGNSESAVPDSEAGFTLLEILVVLAILGLLISLVAPAALRQLGGARQSIARQSIERLGAVLDLYKLDVGVYPSSDQGLQALTVRPNGVAGWSGPYVRGDTSPVDPWNRPYVYRSPSSRGGREYDLCSRGESGDATGNNLICNP